jgi:hypothetical protein
MRVVNRRRWTLGSVLDFNNGLGRIGPTLDGTESKMLTVRVKASQHRNASFEALNSQFLL